MLDVLDPDLALMAARAELVARGDPHQWWLDYIRSERLDVPTVAGLPA